MDRVKQVAEHLKPKPAGLAAHERKNPDDVVITMAIRSPMCKANTGGFRDARTDELLLEMFKQSIAHSKIDPKHVQDIAVGTVLTPDAMYFARVGSLAAGYPESTPVQVVNRFCSSGAVAVSHIANRIKCGEIEVGLAVGVESMSDNPDKGAPEMSDLILNNEASRDCKYRMGWTSENVASDFNITREEQDTFAAESFQRAEHAQKLGYFAKEIVPFTVYQRDPKTGTKKVAVVTQDDGIRYGTTKETLSQIRPAFPQWGTTTTGGNASQIADGAASVLLMTRRKAEELGVPILGKYILTATTGFAPRIMGIGPVPAIREAVRLAGISLEDIDLYEINEAFASQCVYVAKTLNIPRDKIRCSGTRMVATGFNELHRRGAKVLVTSLCVGGGMGVATIFLRE